MRIISNETSKSNKEESENIKTRISTNMEQTDSSKTTFEETMVKEYAFEIESVSFFTSLGILKKVDGLCDMAKFFWKVAEDTMEIGTRIKKFLLSEEYPFTIPQINAAKVNKDECFFKQALDHEDSRIEHLYELSESAPCSFTKGMIGKLIKKHKEIQHLLSLAAKIAQMSEDNLLVQQAIYKLL